MTQIAHRTLGRTGLCTTRLGLGLAALGRPAYHVLGHGQDLAGQQDHAAMQAHAITMLNAAYDAGVRYFDAARSYGDAEHFLRDWLDGRQPGQVTIGSKWGYVYVGAWTLTAKVHEIKHHDLQTFAAQVEQSRQILGPNLRIYAIHSLTPSSPILHDPPLLAALDTLRSQGIALAATISGPHQAAVIDEIVTNHATRFDVLHATFNVLEPAAGLALQRAYNAGIGVIVKEGVANGRLTARTYDDDIRHALSREAERLGCTSDALALAWVLDHAFVDVVLSGATTPSQLHSNLMASQVQLDPQARRNLAKLAIPSEAYWAYRARLPWT